MTTEHTHDGLIGASPKRVEDPPLITGRGCYVDDIQFPGMLHLAFQRSPYPHAKILSIDVSKAKAMAGVEAIITGNDLSEKLNLAPSQVLPNMKIPPHPVLARGAVHCAGVPVAAVVARTRAQAHDAANAIEVEYEALPGVSNAEDALKAGAPLAHEELDSNVCYTMTKNGGDVDKAFAQADHVFTMHIASPRQVALAMEPRGIAVKPDPFGNGLTVWLSTQGPHRARAEIANTLGFPEHKIHLIAPDVGGGFGSKGPVYREDIVACYLALKLRKPVKWVATRSEDFHHDDSRARSGDDFRDGAQKRRQDSRLEGQSRRQSGRISSRQHGRTAAAHDRHGLRQLSNPGLPGRDRRRFHQHLSHRSLSRRRPARVGAQHRASARQGGGGFGHGPAGNPPQKFHSARAVSLHHRDRRRVRFRRFRKTAARSAQDVQL